MKEYLNYNDPFTIASVFETISNKNKKQKANDQIKQINEASKDKINISDYCINTAGGLTDEESSRFYNDINPYN